MSYNEILANTSISISISNSDEMESLGLSQSHLNDAMTEVARHLLALGAKLVYGGDLRQNGFSQLLFELVQRHTSDVICDSRSESVVNYFAWPVHCQYSIETLEKIQDDLLGVAQLRYLARDGSIINWEDRKLKHPITPSVDEWAEGLTSMRKVTVESTQAKIVLGGKTNGYFGVMPGVAEESLMALNIGQPIYIIGGFGGCSRDILKKIGVASSIAANNPWSGFDKFSPFTSLSLNNGLSLEENTALARTPHIDEISILIMKGLATLRHKNII